MPDNFDVKIRTVPAAGQAGVVANAVPESFTRQHMAEIAGFINQAVEVFQSELKSNKAADAEQLSLCEAEITFGIDFQMKGGLLIGSIFQAGINAGAAFQIHITLKKE